MTADEALTGSPDPELAVIVAAVPGVAILYGISRRGDTVTITVAIAADHAVPRTLRAVRAAVAPLLGTEEAAPPFIRVKASRIVG